MLWSVCVSYNSNILMPFYGQTHFFPCSNSVLISAPYIQTPRKVRKLRLRRLIFVQSICAQSTEIHSSTNSIKPLFPPFLWERVWLKAVPQYKAETAGVYAHLCFRFHLRALSLRHRLKHISQIICENTQTLATLTRPAWQPYREWVWPQNKITK